MRPLGLGERLGVQIEVMKIDATLTGDEGAVFLPSRRDRDEVGGRGDLTG